MAFSCITLTKGGKGASGVETNCVTSKAPTAAVPSATPPTPANIPGFSVPEVKFQADFLANPLYPSKYELDFILCFRYKDSVAGDLTTNVLTIKNPFTIK